MVRGVLEIRNGRSRGLQEGRGNGDRTFASIGVMLQ